MDQTSVSVLAFIGESYVRFFIEYYGQLVGLAIQHLLIVFQAILVAVPVGVILGVAITKSERAAHAVIWLAGVMLTIPSIALFGILIPYVGIGKPPVIVALILYSQLPIIRNTYVGLQSVDHATVEAGEGLGMTWWQRLRRVQLPIALPIVMAGVRNAVIILVGIAAIGAFVGAGGLGDFIYRGINQANVEMIVVTTILLSGFALAIDYGFAVIEEVFRLQNGEDIELRRITSLVWRTIA